MKARMPFEKLMKGAANLTAKIAKGSFKATEKRLKGK